MRRKCPRWLMPKWTSKPSSVSQAWVRSSPAARQSLSAWSCWPGLWSGWRSGCVGVAPGYSRAAMPTGRNHLTAVFTRGALWAIGGRHTGGQNLATVERYRPATREQ